MCELLNSACHYSANVPCCLLETIEVFIQKPAAVAAQVKLWKYDTALHVGRRLREQEGQHPLTGQHTANFRLLANR